MRDPQVTIDVTIRKILKWSTFRWFGGTSWPRFLAPPGWAILGGSPETRPWRVAWINDWWWASSDGSKSRPIEVRLVTGGAFSNKVGGKMRSFCFTCMIFWGFNAENRLLSLRMACMFVRGVGPGKEFNTRPTKVQLPEELARQVGHRVGGGCWLYWCRMGHGDSALLPPSEADRHRFLASATWSFASQRCQVLRNSAWLVETWYCWRSFTICQTRRAQGQTG